MLSILYGILSAGTWGAADFIGGIASKRTSPYRVLFLAEIAGLVLFIVIALAIRETVPPPVEMLLDAAWYDLPHVHSIYRNWYSEACTNNDVGFRCVGRSGTPTYFDNVGLTVRPTCSTSMAIPPISKPTRL